MDAKTWKMLWKKEAKEKSCMKKGRKVEHKHETGSWKACIVDFVLLTSRLDTQACFGGPVSLSAQWGNRLFIGLSQLLQPVIITIHDRSHCISGDSCHLCGSSVGLCFFFFLQLLLFIHITRFPSSIHRRWKVSVAVYNKTHNVCVRPFTKLGNI